MSLWEPTGWEHGGGKSAELSVWVQAGGGVAGNTRGTVRGRGRGGAIRLQNTPCFQSMKGCR